MLLYLKWRFQYRMEKYREVKNIFGVGVLQRYKSCSLSRCVTVCLSMSGIP